MGVVYVMLLCTEERGWHTNVFILILKRSEEILTLFFLAYIHTIDPGKNEKNISIYLFYSVMMNDCNDVFLKMIKLCRNCRM